MNLHYRVLGELRHKVEKAQGTISIERSLDVNDLLETLKINGGELVVMVNGQKAGLEHCLAEGDQVVIVPFVVGG